MSAENDWFEYHLTPKGWIVGSKKVGHFGEADEISPPKGRVLTLLFRTYQSCLADKTRHWYEEKWKSDDGDSLSTLMKKFGDRPKGYEHWTKEGFSQ